METSVEMNSSTSAKSYREAVKFLNRLIQAGRIGQSSDTLHHVAASCKNLGIDLQSLRTIHIAGTKGKGSTSSFTERILRQAGLRTGLYTSPHLIDVRERIRINGRLLGQESFASHFWAVHDKLSESANERVDVAVIEVGLGGRLDATNVLPNPIVCGITLLDLDHVAILGDTIEKIAAEKAGIMKLGVPTVTVSSHPIGGLSTLQAVAARVASPLYVAPPLESYPRCQVEGVESDSSLRGKLAGEVTLGLSGAFQRENAALALALARLFAARCAGDLPGNRAAAWGERCAASWGSRMSGWTRWTCQAPRQQQEREACGDDVTKSELVKACKASKETDTSRPEPGNLPVAAVGELDEEELGGLAATNWPGRAQAISCAWGPNTLALLDGAHTPASLATCARWFHQAALACPSPGGRRLHVLIFNTTGGRRDAGLLEPLVVGPDGVWTSEGCTAGFDLVLFCPNDSTVTAVTAPGSNAGAASESGAPVVDYAWQQGLQAAWLAARSKAGRKRRADGDGTEVALDVARPSECWAASGGEERRSEETHPPDPRRVSACEARGLGRAGTPDKHDAEPVRLAKGAQALVHLLTTGAAAGGSSEQVCRVAGSVADALGVVGMLAEARRQHGHGGVTALVTGSLYLVGDVLAQLGAAETLENI